MLYQSYPEYVNTSNKWYPSIPKSWDVRRIKFSFQDKAGAIKTGPFGSQLKSEEMNGSDYKVYNQRNVIQQNLSLGDEYIDEDKFKDLSAFEVFVHDLLVTTRGTIGKCMQVQPNCGKGILHPCLMRLQFKDEVLLNEYFVYLLQESGLLLDELMLSSNATTLEVIYSDTLKNISAPLPPLNEQRGIVKFLDYKTQQIDQLIEKKKALIEKLNEQRLAVITQAVIKGLDKTAKMKPSGVDWLGDVPAHWEVKKMKFAVSLMGGGTPNTNTKEYWDGDIPWVSPKDMKNDVITSTQDYITDSGLKGSATNLIEENEVLIVVRSGILQHSIPVAINAVPVTLNQDMKALIVDRLQLLPEFLKSIIWSNQKPLLSLWSKPGCTVESIESEYMMNTELALPPLAEQEDILIAIEHAITPIDRMLNACFTAIQLYTEYRSSLITAAVTGKIDVRNIQLPQQEASR